jgi:hypothetical protein
MMMTENETDALAPTRVRQKIGSGSLKAKWSQAEDERLLQLLRSGSRANWTELTPNFPGKTAQQISERWMKVVDPALVKGSWTRYEDETIVDFVTRCGTKNWTKLAELLPGRIGKQCRERWRNHLDPLNNKEPWSPEEDALLIQLHEQYGNHWVKIATMMKGRSDNHIKNRWNSTLKKRDPRVTVEYSTPQKRGKQKIETPQSIDQPKEGILESTMDVLPPGFAATSWTPPMVGLDMAPSPFMLDRSPFMFSPSLRSNQLSPWLCGYEKGSVTDWAPCSPRLGISHDLEGHNALMRALDATDKE